MSDFLNAMTEWNKNKDKFVADKLETDSSKLAPRKNIFITIPLTFEEEIKAFVKLKRKEADGLFVSNLDKSKTELFLEFESSNPPPKRSDYE